MALNVGDTVAGRYLIVERLGAGGMGVVFRARDATLDRDIALKALLPHVGQDPALLERFRREARVLAKLRNPGIITVFDLAPLPDGGTALILEYVSGGSLEDQIAGGALEWPRVAQIGVAAAEALAEAHEAGVVHRDIKPSNILLDSDGAVRIADFGIASIAGEVTMSAQGDSIGTPAYMSPEQASGQAAGPASDIYSLGAVLFAAATGRVPFETAEGGFAAALAHINQPVPDPRAARPDLPDTAAALIMRAMQKDPAARFASASEFATSLRTAAALATGDIPVPVPPPVPPPPPASAAAPAAPAAPDVAADAGPDAAPEVAPEVAPPPADATRVGAVVPPPPPAPTPAPAPTPPPPPPPGTAAEGAGALPPMPPLPPPPGQGTGGSGGTKRGLLIGALAALAVIVVGGIIAFVVTRSGSSDATPPAPTTSPTIAPTTGTPSPTAAPTTSPTATSTPTQGASETYSTDFSREEFETFDGELGAVVYENGSLVIAARAELIVSDVLSPVGPVPDVIVDVEARYGEFSDPREGEMGIMCRYENFENHYALGVRSDGSAFIRKRVDDVVTVLAEDANALPGFLPIYELNAQCLGTDLALVVNGDTLLVAQDSDLTFGRTGLFAATTAADSSTVSVFDNYIQVSFPGLG